MPIKKRTLLAATFAAIGIVLVTLAFAVPGPVACTLVALQGFKSLPEGTLVEPGSSQQEQAQVAALLSGARARIEKTYGTPRAQPTIVFFQDSQKFWPLKLNSHGSTNFLGSRACVMVGPKGRNIDVIAHELMHAELFDRVGAWRKFTQIPAWFDEGIAMQVDFRSRYELPPGELANTTYVRRLESTNQFFNQSGQQLVKNYASAKAEVAVWLADVGAQSVYQRFEQIREGEMFSAAVAK
jgi:hypothetical protein